MKRLAGRFWLSVLEPVVAEIWAMRHPGRYARRLDSDVAACIHDWRARRGLL